MGVWRGGMHYTPWQQIAVPMVVITVLAGFMAYNEAKQVEACRADILAMAGDDREGHTVVPPGSIKPISIAYVGGCKGMSDKVIERALDSLPAGTVIPIKPE